MDMAYPEAAGLSVNSTLLISALFALLTAAIYSYLAWRLRDREVSSNETRLAWRLFIMWWLCLAGSTLVGAMLNLLGAFDITNLPLFVTITQVNLLIVCAALWGLLYYLVYLFTGSSRYLIPLSIYYFVFYAVLVYYISASAPADVRIGRWSTSLMFGNQISGPLFLVVLGMLVIPQILGGIAYFSLYFRVDDSTQRYRILLVSWSIIVWFGSALVASLVGLTEMDSWQLTSRLIGLIATLLVLFAYYPPRWIRERLGVVSLAEQSQVWPPSINDGLVGQHKSIGFPSSGDG